MNALIEMLNVARKNADLSYTTTTTTTIHRHQFGREITTRYCFRRRESVRLLYCMARTRLHAAWTCGDNIEWCWVKSAARSQLAVCACSERIRSICDRWRFSPLVSAPVPFRKSIIIVDICPPIVGVRAGG